MNNIFDTYCVCMNTLDNTVSIISNALSISNFNVHIDDTVDIKARIEHMVKFIVKKIPFSLLRPKIMILIPDNIDGNDERKIAEIVYESGKVKFREQISINVGSIILGVFENFNRCIYLVQLNNEILGFAGFAGEMITRMMYFNSSNSVDYMIEQINSDINEDVFVELKAKYQDIDIDFDSSNNRIILSFNPEYYFNRKIETIENNYVPDILNVGLKKIAKRIFYN